MQCRCEQRARRHSPCTGIGQMDHAVSLVQAYLQLNGYFTSAEYPIIAAAGRNGFRSITDIDILGFRFPDGLPTVSMSRRKRTPRGLDTSELDPGLGATAESIDMIIGEVKEGRVGINSGVRDPSVLKTVIRRLGDPNLDIESVVRDLLDRGVARLPSGFTVRLIAFGAFPPAAPVPPCRIVSLGHVLEFLQTYVRKHWQVLRHLQFKDPAFGAPSAARISSSGSPSRLGTTWATPMLIVIRPISSTA